MPASKYTATGQAATSAAVLQDLAGARPSDPEDPVYGTAYDFFGGGEEGRQEEAQESGGEPFPSC